MTRHLHENPLATPSTGSQTRVATSAMHCLVARVAATAVTRWIGDKRAPAASPAGDLVN